MSVQAFGKFGDDVGDDAHRGNIMIARRGRANPRTPPLMRSSEVCGLRRKLRRFSDAVSNQARRLPPISTDTMPGNPAPAMGVATSVAILNGVVTATDLIAVFQRISTALAAA